MTTQLFIQPLDVWLFRDGRPFDAGSTARAESVFPPYPTVIQGAFRTHKLIIKGVDLSKENQGGIANIVGEADSFGELHLRGPYIARRNSGTITRYFPQPADAIVEDQDLTPAKLGNPTATLKTSASLQLLGLDQKSGKQKESLWLDETSLVKYLGGETVTGTKGSDLFLREDRIGIGMNERRVVDESMLYETEFIRPCKDVGLLVEMNGYNDLQWEQSGVMSLGGEGKQALFESVTFEAPTNPLSNTTRFFKLYFATPAFFEGGWQPAAWGKFFDGNTKLIGAAVRGYESLGGFNWAANANSANAHRPARRFVPAGSVYFFEGTPQLKADLEQQAVTDYGGQIGFGQIIIKEIKEW